MVGDVRRGSRVAGGLGVGRQRPGNGDGDRGSGEEGYLARRVAAYNRCNASGCGNIRRGVDQLAGAASVGVVTVITV